MADVVQVLPDLDVAIVNAEALARILPVLTRQVEQLRADGADPAVVQVIDRLRVAAAQMKGSVVPRHAARRFLSTEGSSQSARVGLTSAQAAVVAGVTDRAMRKRGPGMRRAGVAWLERGSWRFDAAAVRPRAAD